MIQESAGKSGPADHPLGCLSKFQGPPQSYQSVRRIVIKRNWHGASRSTVRMEDTPAGEVAEADFGRLGLIADPQTGKRWVVWAMLIVLCHSRHCFLWPLHQQTLPEVIAGLEVRLLLPHSQLTGIRPRKPEKRHSPAETCGADFHRQGETYATTKDSQAGYPAGRGLGVPCPAGLLQWPGDQHGLRLSYW